MEIENKFRPTSEDEEVLEFNPAEKKRESLTLEKTQKLVPEYISGRAYFFNPTGGPYGNEQQKWDTEAVDLQIETEHRSTRSKTYVLVATFSNESDPLKNEGQEQLNMELKPTKVTKRVYPIRKCYLQGDALVLVSEDIPGEKVAIFPPGKEFKLSDPKQYDLFSEE